MCHTGVQNNYIIQNESIKGCFFYSLTLTHVQTQRLQRELRAEHDLAQRELRTEHDLTQRELQESSRRLQQECDHRVALERDKVRLMEEERARLLQQVQREDSCSDSWVSLPKINDLFYSSVSVIQIADGESRYKQLEKEFQLYREQQNIRPEYRLQSEINLLTLEKVIIVINNKGNYYLWCQCVCSCVVSCSWSYHHSLQWQNTNCPVSFQVCVCVWLISLPCDY